MSSLPDGVTSRSLRHEDAAPSPNCSPRTSAHGLPGKLSAEDVLSWWRRTDLDLNSWLRGGWSPVAAGWLDQYGGDVLGGGAVRPGEKGRGLGVALVEIAERRARELGARFVGSALGADTRRGRCSNRAGYNDVRHHYVMAIGLDSEPAAPELPDGLPSIRSATRTMRVPCSGWRSVRRGVGPSPLPFDEWWAMRKDEDKSLWWVIRDGSEIAACERCEEGYGGGFVGMVGVRKPWRRRGFGKALLLHAFREFRLRGFERVSLGVDSANPTGATRLYESVGMHVESEHVTFEKELA